MKRPTWKQAALLGAIAKPSVAVLCPRKRDWGPMQRHGWVEPVPDVRDQLRITPAGLRALADWLEAERARESGS